MGIPGTIMQLTFRNRLRNPIGSRLLWDPVACQTRRLTKSQRKITKGIFWWSCRRNANWISELDLQSIGRILVRSIIFISVCVLKYETNLTMFFWQSMTRRKLYFHFSESKIIQSHFALSKWFLTFGIKIVNLKNFNDFCVKVYFDCVTYLAYAYNIY